VSEQYDKELKSNCKFNLMKWFVKFLLSGLMKPVLSSKI
jgi:hypothetical protein